MEFPVNERYHSLWQYGRYFSRDLTLMKYSMPRVLLARK
jgi:hypothetical protein